MKRKLPLIFIVVSTLLVCLIIAFINSSTISSIDAWVYQGVSSSMNPNLTLTMRFITESGGTLTLIVLCISFFLFTKSRKYLAIPATITLVVAALTNTFLKLLFSRERPDILQLIYEPDYSFPSGHAMINMAFYTIIFLIANKTVKNKKTKTIISITCIVLPLIIGISRIYLGVHYATDVIAGWFLGFVMALIIFKVLERWNKFNNYKL